jgi:hypothetical protein
MTSRRAHPFSDRKIGVEATATARFVNSGGADNDLVAFANESLGFGSDATTRHAHRLVLADKVGNSEQERHGTERLPLVRLIETRHNHANATISQLLTDIGNAIITGLH